MECFLMYEYEMGEFLVYIYIHRSSIFALLSSGKAFNDFCPYCCTVIKICSCARAMMPIRYMPVKCSYFWENCLYGWVVMRNMGSKIASLVPTYRSCSRDLVKIIYLRTSTSKSACIREKWKWNCTLLRAVLQLYICIHTHKCMYIYTVKLFYWRFKICLEVDDDIGFCMMVNQLAIGVLDVFMVCSMHSLLIWKLRWTCENKKDGMENVEMVEIVNKKMNEKIAGCIE